MWNHFPEDGRRSNTGDDLIATLDNGGLLTWIGHPARRGVLMEDLMKEAQLIAEEYSKLFPDAFRAD